MNSTPITHDAGFDTYDAVTLGGVNHPTPATTRRWSDLEQHTGPLTPEVRAEIKAACERTSNPAATFDAAVDIARRDAVRGPHAGTLVHEPPKPRPPSLQACDGCGARPEKHDKLGFSFGLHRDDCPHALAAAREERRAREAPLVALVAAVPEGLDSVGWRAAVLAVNEMHIRRRRGEPLDNIRGVWTPELVSCLVAYAEGKHPAPVTIYDEVDTAVDAYQRAITPHCAPPPERKGATWRSRGPALVVDRGED